MNIEELEQKRKTIVKRETTLFLVDILLTLIVGILTKRFIFGFITFMVFSVIIGIINYKPRIEFQLQFKNTFVLKALNNIFTDLSYQPEQGLDRSLISNTNMMNMGDTYNSNDLLSGKYKNINVVQADIHIEEEREDTDSDGHTTTTYVTIFRGKWMIFDFNKTFKANIQVAQKHFPNARVTRLGTNKYQKVQMEDQEFNKNFRVFAQDDHEAFYILTPSLMDKIKTLANETSGYLMLCFVDNKLHVALHNNKDSFEPNLYKKLDEEKINEELSKDIKTITNFIDKLDLDNDLFKMEV